jgi:hypothetical protein
VRIFVRLFASSMGTFSEASSLRCRINDGRLSSSKTRSSSSSKPVRLCGSVPFEACSARSRQSFMRIPSQIATQLIVDSPTRLGNNAHLLRKCRNLLLAVATRGRLDAVRFREFPVSSSQALLRRMRCCDENVMVLRSERVHFDQNL